MDKNEIRMNNKAVEHKFFKVGDRIKHKISEEIGIVTSLNYKCDKHPKILWNFENCTPECKIVQIDNYDISYGFNQSKIHIDGFLIELVNEMQNRGMEE